MKRYPTTLIIAGSDSCGGAGIQADLKTCAALGVYAATAITAVTAQNTQGVRAVQPIEPNIVRQQIEAVLEDFTVDSIKIGMLCNADIANTVADVLTSCHIPIILDPVMVSTSGCTLLERSAIDVIVKRLFPIAEIITPNINEAGLLTSTNIHDSPQITLAAHQLLDMGCNAVLMKGGHLPGAMATDYLITPDREEIFSTPFIDTRNTHGTGCTLSSAIACNLGSGMGLEESVRAAKDYLTGALKAMLDLGQGSGPLDHGWQHPRRQAEKL
jgi:hydroxymethylpyrimidine/phosphomethylpyrimidine kinase